MIINSFWNKSSNDWKEWEKEYVPSEFDLIMNGAQWNEFFEHYVAPSRDTALTLTNIMFEHKIIELLASRNSRLTRDGHMIFRFVSLNDAIMFKLKV